MQGRQGYVWSKAVTSRSSQCDFGNLFLVAWCELLKWFGFPRSIVLLKQSLKTEFMVCAFVRMKVPVLLHWE